MKGALIKVYIEGGGDSRDQRAELRQGFDSLFRVEKNQAANKGVSLQFTCCGPRREAYEAFAYSTKIAPESIQALLVDSETSIPGVPADRSKDAHLRVSHLSQRHGTDGRGQGDEWDFKGIDPNRVHLMVQCMEAWIASDSLALEKAYKQGFNADKLPRRPNLEEEPKADLYKKLESATKDTRMGAYSKGGHSGKLVALLSPDRIDARCPRFRLFREWLVEVIDRAAIQTA